MGGREGMMEKVREPSKRNYLSVTNLPIYGANWYMNSLFLRTQVAYISAC